MHHALQIEEILLNIFGHCHLPGGESATSDLPALARTCCAFKEPALGVLWERLGDPSPLAKCIPEASYSQGDRCYSFSRSLTQIEWTILRSYTYRIRSILDEDDTLNWESVGTFLNPPTTESLFSNLRYLRAGGLTEINIQHFLCMSFPSLVTLDVWFVAKETLCALQDSLESFFKSSPNIRRLSIQLRGPDAAFSKFFSNYICRWRDLQTVECSYTTLDMDAFAHLSRMPALTTLGCTLGATLSASEATLFFPNLHRLKLYSEFLDPISWLLSRTRLLVITDLTVIIQSCPSKQGFSSSLATWNIFSSIQSGTGTRQVESRPMDCYSFCKHVGR